MAWKNGEFDFHGVELFAAQGKTAALLQLPSPSATGRPVFRSLTFLSIEELQETGIWIFFTLPPPFKFHKVSKNNEHRISKTEAGRIPCT